MIVGSSGNAAIVAEFGLLFHVILAITNLLQLLNDRLMDHLETTIQHDSSGRNGLVFDRNVALLLDFVKARENPSIIQQPTVPLYNFVTKQLVSDTTMMRLLNALEHGEAAYKAFRDERYVLKSKKLSVTISKLNLPSFNFYVYKEKTNTQITQSSVSSKGIAAAQMYIEIAVLRGMSLNELYTHDIIDSSPLFLGDITTQPDKAQLITELETNLT